MLFPRLIYSNNIYAIDIPSFDAKVYDAKVYSAPDIYELKQKNPVIAYGVMAFREDYKAHMWHVSTSNKENYLVDWVKLKYTKSVYGVLPNEIAKCLFNINEYKNNNTNVLTCVGNVDNYTISNFVYLIFINFINHALNGNSETNENLVDNVITKIDEKYEKKYSDRMQTASYHVKEYTKQLSFYDYLSRLRIAKKE